MDEHWPFIDDLHILIIYNVVKKCLKPSFWEWFITYTVPSIFGKDWDELLLFYIARMYSSQDNIMDMLIYDIDTSSDS